MRFQARKFEGIPIGLQASDPPKLVVCPFAGPASARRHLMKCRKSVPVEDSAFHRDENAVTFRGVSRRLPTDILRKAQTP